MSQNFSLISQNRQGKFRDIMICKRDRHVNSARNLAIHGKRLVEQNKALRQVLLEIGIKSEFELQLILDIDMFLHSSEYSELLLKTVMKF